MQGVLILALLVAVFVTLTTGSTTDVLVMIAFICIAYSAIKGK